MTSLLIIIEKTSLEQFLEKFNCVKQFRFDLKDLTYFEWIHEKEGRVPFDLDYNEQGNGLVVLMNSINDRGNNVLSYNYLELFEILQELNPSEMFVLSNFDIEDIQYINTLKKMYYSRTFIVAHVESNDN